MNCDLEVWSFTKYRNATQNGMTQTSSIFLQVYIYSTEISIDFLFFREPCQMFQRGSHICFNALRNIGGHEIDDD